MLYNVNVYYVLVKMTLRKSVFNKQGDPSAIKNEKHVERRVGQGSETLYYCVVLYGCLSSYQNSLNPSLSTP